MTKILIIGAGAVGQVYGHFLQRGGAEVSFLVKAKYRQQCEKGFTLYRSRRRGLGRAEVYKAHNIFTEIAEIAKYQWDQVWLSMSSTGLQGGWLKDLKSAVGHRTVVMLQPDIDDHEYVAKFFDEEQLVHGVVNFLGFQAPLPDLPSYHPDSDKRGVAYILLPFMTAGFSGKPDRLEPVLTAVSEGRFPAKVKQDAPRLYVERSAMMIPLVAALEMEGWSFKRLYSSELLGLALEACNQALAVVGVKFEHSVSLSTKLMSPLVVRVMLPLLSIMTPVDIEAYIKYHFVKTAEQTRFILSHFVAEGEKAGLPVDSLATLLEGLPQNRGIATA